MKIAGLYRKIIQRAPMGYACHRIICDADGIPVDYEFMEVNPEFQIFTGFEDTVIIGKRVSEIMPGVLTDNFDWIGFYGAVALGGESQSFGSYSEALGRWYSVNVFSPEIGYFVTLFNDITLFNENAKALKRQLKSEKLIAEISSSLVSVHAGNLGKKMNLALQLMGDFFKVDRASIFQYAGGCRSLNNTFQWCAPGISSQKEFLQGIPVSDFHSWEKQLRQFGIISVDDSRDMPPEAESEQKLLIEHGVLSTLDLPMMKNNEVTGFIGLDAVGHSRVWTSEEIAVFGILNNIISDAFNRYQSDQEILYLSYHDKLTGLYNRRFFEEELSRLDTERQLPLSVIIGDVNGLKITNDVFGHQTGDQLLKMIGRILSENSREEDVIARWGGDEYVILLPRTPSEDASEICKRIQNACAAASNLPVQMSISLGHATKKHISQSMEHVLNSAEDWMYRRKLLESRSFRSSMVTSLISSLSEKSCETAGHTERMGRLSTEIGMSMGLAEEEMETLNLLAMLHDIGKVAISEHILTKAGSLNEEEWTEIQRHSEIGYRIAQSTVELGQLADLILSHHERWDGSGYPNNLKGEEIPKLARIVAVIDSYDVMTHERPYSIARSREEALLEIERCSGLQFDPTIADLFLKVMKGIRA